MCRLYEVGRVKVEQDDRDQDDEDSDEAANDDMDDDDDDDDEDEDDDEEFELDSDDEADGAEQNDENRGDGNNGEACVEITKRPLKRALIWFWVLFPHCHLICSPLNISFNTNNIEMIYHV